MVASKGEFFCKFQNSSIEQNCEGSSARADFGAELTFLSTFVCFVWGATDTSNPFDLDAHNGVQF